MTSVVDTVEPTPKGAGKGPSQATTGSRVRSVLVAETAAWVVVAAFVLLASGLAPPFGLSDTASHILLFAGLSATTVAAAFTQSRATVVRLVVGVAILAVLSEIAQNLISSRRVGEWRDIRSDLIGIGLGTLAAASVRMLLASAARAQRAIAVVSLFGLLGATLAVAGTTSSVRNWWQCRGESVSVQADPIAGLDPTVADLTIRSVAGGDETVPPPSRTDGLSGAWCQAMVHNGFTVSVWAQSTDPEQWGPTRIVSSSAGIESDDTNFHIGQQLEDLTIRIRTGESDQSYQEDIPGIFATNAWQHLVFRYSKGSVTLFVDGVERYEFDTPYNWISAWDSEFPLLVGDELTQDRTFYGSISDTRFFDDALTDEDIARLAEVPRS